MICNCETVSVQMWEDLILKAKEGGLDVVETYVFWNVHEPSPGNVLLHLHSLRFFSLVFGPLILAFVQCVCFCM